MAASVVVNVNVSVLKSAAASDVEVSSTSSSSSPVEEVAVVTVKSVDEVVSICAAAFPAVSAVLLDEPESVAVLLDTSTTTAPVVVEISTGVGEAEVESESALVVEFCASVVDDASMLCDVCVTSIDLVLVEEPVP